MSGTSIPSPDPRTLIKPGPLAHLSEHILARITDVLGADDLQ